MKIFYSCECCGDAIDTIEVQQVDEARFGFDSLTSDERSELIHIDALANAMYVKSLCDHCIEALGITDEAPATPLATRMLH